MRCPSGIFASRVLMIVVNLFIIWSWRKQLIKEEKEDRVRAEIRALDDVIACLENVLAGVEAKEIEEQLLGENARMDQGDVTLIKKGLMEWNQKKKLDGRKMWKENQLTD